MQETEVMKCIWKAEEVHRIQAHGNSIVFIFTMEFNTHQAGPNGSKDTSQMQCAGQVEEQSVGFCRYKHAGDVILPGKKQKPAGVSKRNHFCGG